MDLSTYVLSCGLAFGHNITGLFVRPYETYRRIADRGQLGELGFIAILLGGYFALASLVKTAAFRPYLLTRQFVLLSGGSIVSFLAVVAVLWIVGTLVGGKGKPVQFMVAWGYTLIPTVLWFLATSVLYVVLPPPRTESAQGILFSMLYLVFSTTLLFWKIILAYLTLRFGMKLDLAKILRVVFFALPCFAFYSVVMYKMGIFKVPFI